MEKQGTSPSVLEPLSVHGDIAKFRQGLTRKAARGQELLSLLDAAEARYVAPPPGASAFVLALNDIPHTGVIDDLTRWERGIQALLHKHLGPVSEEILQHRQLPFRRDALAPQRLADQRSFLRARIGDLEAIWQRTPGRQVAAPAPAPPLFLELRDSGLLPNDVLDGYVRRMSRTSRPAERSEAIGAVKELLEAVFKATLDLTGGHYNRRDEMSVLGREVRRVLKTHESAPTSEGVQMLDRMYSSLGSLEQSLTELRNMYGSGHGRTSHPAGLAQRHALLAIDAATAHVRYLVLTLQDSGLLIGGSTPRSSV